MYIAKIGDSKYKVELLKDGVYVDGEFIDIDFKKLNSRGFQAIYKFKNFDIEILEKNVELKNCKIKINGKILELGLSDQFDELLHSLGMDNLNIKKTNEIKAPMPGLVLRVIAKTGEEFKKGDNLLVLEAMKMENVLKAPGDGKVKEVLVQAGDKVEKNQILFYLD